MKNKFFIRPHEFELLEEHMEKNSGEMITVQGLALTPAELLEKYTQGGMSEIRVAPPVFSPDPEDLDQDDLGELRRMELEELHSRGDALQAQYDALLEEIREKEREVKKAVKTAVNEPEAVNKAGSGDSLNPPSTDTTT